MRCVFIRGAFDMDFTGHLSGRSEFTSMNREDLRLVMLKFLGLVFCRLKLETKLTDRRTALPNILSPCFKWWTKKCLFSPVVNPNLETTVKSQVNCWQSVLYDSVNPVFWQAESSSFSLEQ